MADAPSPWNTRKTNSHCRLGASALHTDETMNTSRPSLKSFLNPTRSPIEENGSSVMTSVSPYALTIQTTDEAELPSSRAIEGNATFAIEASSTERLIPTRMVSAAHLRRGSGKPSCASGARAFCSADIPRFS